MAVALRLTRIGKKHDPKYRIVAVDKRKKRDGKYIEKIGYYDPKPDPVQFELNQERFSYWESRGAQISEGLHKLLKYSKKLSKNNKR